MPPPVFFSFFLQIGSATVCGSETAWCRGWASVGASCLVRKPARGYPLGLCWSRSARTGRDVVEQAPHGGRLAHAHCLAGSSLRCDDAPRGAPLRRDCVGQRPLLLAGSCTGDRRLPHGRAQRCVSPVACLPALPHSCCRALAHASLYRLVALTKRRWRQAIAGCGMPPLHGSVALRQPASGSNAASPGRLCPREQPGG